MSTSRPAALSLSPTMCGSEWLQRERRTPIFPARIGLAAASRCRAERPLTPALSRKPGEGVHNGAPLRASGKRGSARGSLGGFARLFDQNRGSDGDFEQCAGLDLWQRLDATQFSVHRLAAHTGFFDDLLGLVELFLDLVEDAAKFSKLRLDGGEDVPDFARTL